MADFFFNALVAAAVNVETPVNVPTGVLITSDGVVVSSGWTLDRQTVLPKMELLVFNSGTAENTQVSGGSMTVYFGGVATSIGIDGGWEPSLTVSSGGTALFASTGRRGSMTIVGGGFAGHTVIDHWASWAHISSGGIASSITINSGFLFVSSGGVADYILVCGGNLTVESGGTVSLAFDPWRAGDINVSQGATITYLERDAGIYYGGNGQLVSKGDYFSDLTVNGGYSALVYSGGTANETIVNEDGRMYVSSGGIANGLIIHDGSAFIEETAQLNISQGSILQNVSASSDAIINCLIGETVENWSGCTLGTGNTINSGAFYFNGSRTTITLSENVLNNFGTDEIEERLIISGITATNPIIRSACRIFAKGNATVSGGTALTEGNLGLQESATAYDFTVGGEGVTHATFNIMDNARAYRTVVSASGYLGVNASAVANGVEMYDTAVARIYSGGQIESVVVNSGATLSVRGGATIIDPVISSGGSMPMVSGGGTVSNAVFMVGAKVTASSGAVISGAKIIGDAIANTDIRVLSGAEIISCHLSGGRLIVSSGGTARYSIVESKNVAQNVFGTAISTTIIAGWEAVSSGGSSINTVMSGGIHIISGYALSTVISAGSAIVRGIAEHTTATGARARIYVSSGGTAYAPVVMSGASLVISSGGSALAVTSNAGANIMVDENGYIKYAE